MNETVQLDLFKEDFDSKEAYIALAREEYGRLETMGIAESVLVAWGYEIAHGYS